MGAVQHGIYGNHDLVKSIESRFECLLYLNKLTSTCKVKNFQYLGDARHVQTADIPTVFVCQTYATLTV